MKRKKIPGIVSAGRKEKTFHTSTNKAASRKSQGKSPWANAPVYDPLEEVARWTQDDVDRLDALMDEDRGWFVENPDRRFHIRNATPHELDIGLARGWVVVARYSGGRTRLPVPLPALAHHDASEHDTEEKARELFDWLTWDCTAANTHPFLFGVIEEIRRGASWSH